MILLADSDPLSISNWLQFGLSTALAIWLLTIEIPRQRKDERASAEKVQSEALKAQEKAQVDFAKALDASNKAWAEQFAREREMHEKVLTMTVAANKEALQLIASQFLGVISQMRDEIKKANGS